MTGKQQRPRKATRRPTKARIYRARFKPFEATKFLNVDRLRKVARTNVEIGTVEAPGVSFTLVAEIRRGMITRLRPVSCAACKPTKVSKAKLSKLVAELKPRIDALKISGPVLPVRLTISRIRGWRIPPIVVIIDEGIPCIWIYIGGVVCIICEFGWICVGPPHPRR